MQSAQPKNPTNSYAPFSSNENAQTTNRTPQKKTHQIEKARNFGWCRERRVRRREGLGRGRVRGKPGKGGPGDVQGRGSRAGRYREGEVEGGGSRKGSTDPRPKLAKRCKFPGFGVQVFGVFGFGKSQSCKNASVSHSVRLEKSPRLKKKNAPVERLGAKGGKTLVVWKRGSLFFSLATEKSTAFKEKQPWRICVYLSCLLFFGPCDKLAGHNRYSNPLAQPNVPTHSTTSPECSDGGGIRIPLSLQWLKRPTSPTTPLFLVRA